MTDRFSISRSNRTNTKVLRSKLRSTMTAEQLIADRQEYSNWTTDRKEKIKSPLTFLKISANSHYTHLQSRTGQLAAKVLQKSAILPTFKII